MKKRFFHYLYTTFLSNEEGLERILFINKIALMFGLVGVLFSIITLILFPQLVFFPLGALLISIFAFHFTNKKKEQLVINVICTLPIFLLSLFHFYIIPKDTQLSTGLILALVVLSSLPLLFYDNKRKLNSVLLLVWGFAWLIIQPIGAELVESDIPFYDNWTFELDYFTSVLSISMIVINLFLLRHYHIRSLNNVNHLRNNLENSLEDIRHKNFELEANNQAYQELTEKLKDSNIKLDQEIRERKAIAKSLLHSESKLSSFVNQSTIGFSVINQKGEVVFWNAKNAEIYGISKEDVLGKNVMDLRQLVTPTYNMNSPQYQYIERLFEDFFLTDQIGLSEEYEVEIERANDGSLRNLKNTVFSYQVDNEILIGRTTIDQTEFIRKSKELEQYKTQLERLIKDKTYQLQNTEVKYKTIFEQNPSLISISEIETGKFIEVNNTFCKETGFTKNELIGSTSIELGLLTPEYRKKVVSVIKKNEFAYNQELVLQPKIGTQIHCLTSGGLIEIRNKPYLLQISVNISKRHQLQKEIERTKNILEQITHNLPDYLFVYDLDTKSIEYQSVGFAERFGYSLEQVILNKDILGKIIHPDNLEQTSHFFDDFENMQTNLPHELEIQIKSVYNNYHWFYARFVSFSVDNNQVRKVLGILNENTIKKLAKIQLLRSEKNFREIFELSKDIIVLINKKGRILKANKVFEEKSGLKIDNTKAYFFNEVLSSKYRELVYSKISSLYKGVESDPIEVEMRSKDEKEFPMEINSQLIFFEGEQAILAIGRDISERKEFQEKLVDSIISAEESERDKLSRNLHDDLGPLLSSLKMYIVSLENNPEIKRQQIIRDKLNLLIEEAISSVKEISHDLSPRLLTSNGLIAAVTAFLRTVETFIQVDFQENIELKRFHKETELVVYRLIKELINNTIKHAQAEKLRLRIKYSLHQIIVDYADDGIGFDYEKQLKEPTGMGIGNVVTRINSQKGEFTCGKGIDNKGVRYIIVIPTTNK